MALESSAEHPLPLRRVSLLMADWIGRLGWVWVEGQVTEITRRPGVRTAFLVLRDTSADLSQQIRCDRALLDALPVPLAEGAQVVLHVRPMFYAPRGTLSLTADEIRPVGLGALLARLEQLRSVLGAEGLFAAERKRPLPFLPSTVGVICGRASAAERDVVDNARRRWPAVRFRVEEVAVQGPGAVTEVVAALQRLDADRDVDVVVITRGGGSVEDLLPFSNEALVRAVSAARTPVVSAIGHEQDSPLLDLVADVRASTPTDAAKRVVPDVGEEQHRLDVLRERGRRCAVQHVRGELATVAALRNRPVVARPQVVVDVRVTDVRGLLDRSRRSLRGRLDVAVNDLAHARARVASLSPAATLERGYAVVQRGPDGAVVRTPAEAPDGTELSIRVSGGRIAASSRGPRPS